MGELAKQEDYFTELDRRDQQQIILEATGEITKELFYDVKGKKGLSYKGVNTTAFFMGDIHTEPGVEWEKVEMNSQVYWSATVRAINLTFNLAALGMAEVPEMMDVYDIDPNTKQKVSDGQGGYKMHKEFDRFCRRKALGMAQRNAKSAVMPTGMLEAFLKYYIRRAAGETTLEPPFNPRKIDAEYKILPDQEPKAEKPKTPKQKQAPPAKAKVTQDILEYNLKASDPKLLELIDVLEDATGFTVAPKPMVTLSEADQYKIEGMLGDFGAVWTDNRYWRIPPGGK